MKILGFIGDYDKDTRTTRIEDEYIKSFEKYDVMPLILPFVSDNKILDEYIDLCDGFVFIGGNDISPYLYNEDKIKECGKIYPEIDSISISLIKKIYDKNKPLLGICRGMQLMNVALGGSLYQDIYKFIDTEIDHNPKNSSWNFAHKVINKKDSIFYDIYKKDEIYVNSLHHQAINKLSLNLDIGQISEDNVIEAVYSSKKRFFVGVQWHPEKLKADSLETLKLFDKFIENI